MTSYMQNTPEKKSHNASLKQGEQFFVVRAKALKEKQMNAYVTMSPNSKQAAPNALFPTPQTREAILMNTTPFQAILQKVEKVQADLETESTARKTESAATKTKFIAMTARIDRLERDSILTAVGFSARQTISRTVEKIMSDMSAPTVGGQGRLKHSSLLELKQNYEKRENAGKSSAFRPYLGMQKYFNDTNNIYKIEDLSSLHEALEKIKEPVLVRAHRGHPIPEYEKSIKNLIFGTVFSDINEDVPWAGDFKAKVEAAIQQGPEITNSPHMPQLVASEATEAPLQLQHSKKRPRVD